VHCVRLIGFRVDDVVFFNSHATSCRKKQNRIQCSGFGLAILEVSYSEMPIPSHIKRSSNPKVPGFLKIESRRLSAYIEGLNSSQSVGWQVMTGQSPSHNCGFAVHKGSNISTLE